MTDMVERVALAIRGVVNDPDVKEQMYILAKASSSDHVEQWLNDKMARAAIEAMRQPTQEMAMAGHYVSGGELSDIQAKLVFIGMIETALGKKP